MKARDVMTRDIVSVEPDASILKAARLMLQHRISGLPVVGKSGKLVGIVTEGDFLRRAETGTEHHGPRWIEFLIGPGKLAEEYVHTSGRKVEEVMTPEVRTIGEDTTLEQAVDLMERHHIKRLPVLRESKLVGIVTRANVMRAMLTRAQRPGAGADDSAIREKFVAELKKQPWAPLALVDVAVHNGVLKYSGCITDERQRKAIRVAAENIPGVSKIEDDLVWIEPISGMVVEAPKH